MRANLFLSFLFKTLVFLSGAPEFKCKVSRRFASVFGRLSEFAVNSTDSPKRIDVSGGLERSRRPLRDAWQFALETQDVTDNLGDSLEMLSRNFIADFRARM